MPLPLKCKKSTFSQHDQDVFVWINYLRHLGNNGTYVDVGAYDPHVFSNTAFFDICLGWTGICIEANPSRRPLFLGQTPLRTCQYVDACVSDGFFEMDLVLSGADEDQPWASHIKEPIGADFPVGGVISFEGKRLLLSDIYKRVAL